MRIASELLFTSLSLDRVANSCTRAPKLMSLSISLRETFQDPEAVTSRGGWCSKPELAGFAEYSYVPPYGTRGATSLQLGCTTLGGA